MKLHLGCGSKYIPGFTHIDILDFPHIDVRHSIDNLPMIPSGSVDVIYACHVLEHFLRRDVHRVLKEWLRVLKPGTGILRLAVPDFEAVIAEYEANHDLPKLCGFLYGGQNYAYNFHYMVYDFQTLEKTLHSAGFTNVQRYDWRQTEHADLDDYSQAYIPHMAKETGRLMSLNVEATRP